MPIIKSAIKRMKQTAKKRARNTGAKRSMRAELKSFSAAIEAKDAKKAADALKRAQAKIDSAVKKNLLKKNTAARRLSALSKQAKDIGVKHTKTVKKPAAKTTSSPAKKTTPKKAAPKAAAKKPVAKKTPAKK